MKTILISGATSGIGLELARWYQAQNEKLVLLGRRPRQTLTDPLFTSENYCQVDLSDPQAPQVVLNWLSTHQIKQVDRLIHNAAVGWYGDPTTQTAATTLELVEVNLKAPIRLTHALLPHLKTGSGKIAFISSVATVLPTADYATYTATKAALDGFARSLRIELAGQVEVQLIHPGATRTPMHQKIGIPLEVMNWEKFPPASEVAAQIGQAISTPRRQVAIGGKNKALRLLGKTFPNLLRRMMTKQTAVKNWPSPTTLPHVVITGAADGIGKALALRFAHAGYQITGIDFDKAKSIETETEISALGVQVNFITADLANPTQVQSTIEALTQLPPIDILINNAGISAAGYFSHLDLDTQLKVIDVNFTAPLLLTIGLLSQKQLTAEAQAVFVSSLSYYVSYPGAAVYAATKDGLASFASSLHVDGRHPAKMTVVYPGPTRTVHARRYSPDNSKEGNRMPPEKVAEAIFDGATKKRFTILPGGGAKLFAFLGRVAPRLMEKAMEKMILAKFSPPPAK